MKSLGWIMFPLMAVWIAGMFIPACTPTVMTWISASMIAVYLAVMTYACVRQKRYTVLLGLWGFLSFIFLVIYVTMKEHSF